MEDEEGSDQTGLTIVRRVDKRRWYHLLEKKEAKPLEKSWHILYCDEQITHCPVTDFIDTRSTKHQIKILRFLSLLEEMGPTLKRPYADVLYDGIHELRIKLSGDQIRLLYFFCYRKFIVLYCAFIKNTQRVPENLIHKVIRYRQRFLDTTSRRQLETLINADL